VAWAAWARVEAHGLVLRRGTPGTPGAACSEGPCEASGPCGHRAAPGPGTSRPAGAPSHPLPAGRDLPSTTTKTAGRDKHRGDGDENGQEGRRTPEVPTARVGHTSPHEPLRGYGSVVCQ